MHKSLCSKTVQFALQTLQLLEGLRVSCFELLQHFPQLDLLPLVDCTTFLRKSDSANRALMLWHALEFDQISRNSTLEARHTPEHPLSLLPEIWLARNADISERVHRNWALDRSRLMSYLRSAVHTFVKFPSAKAHLTCIEGFQVVTMAQHLPLVLLFDRLRRTLPWTILILAWAAIIPIAAFAQMPGHWQRVFAAKNWQPKNIAFYDSAYGIILADSTHLWRSGTIRTTDAGATWQLHSFLDTGNFSFPRDAYHVFDLPTRSDVYAIESAYRGLISHDSGLTWTVIAYPNLVHIRPQFVGARVFANGQGFCTAILDSGSALAIYIEKTVDSASSFFRTAFEGQPAFAGILDAVYFDTLEFWLSDAIGKALHTTNGGKTWEIKTIFDSLANARTCYISTTSDRSHFYVLVYTNMGVFDKVAEPDFAVTTDAGSTWRIDSSLGGARMYRLVAQTPDKIWAFVGHSQWVASADLASVPTGFNQQFADSLFYSSDGGRSWFKDSTTFIGDTLAEMCWPDSAHGYITAWCDRTMFVYRYVSNSARVEPPPEALTTTQLRILNSPVADVLSFESQASGNATIRVFDLLGRERKEESRRLTSPSRTDLAVGDLEPGYYLLNLSIGARRISTGFIKR